MTVQEAQQDLILRGQLAEKMPLSRSEPFTIRHNHGFIVRKLSSEDFWGYSLRWRLTTGTVSVMSACVC